ncbi:leucine-rich repeat extensin-like protein 5 [Choloepus didactylus]|uniref:leucine-rich repeat extensin-like protein 5 n=1 Tax=Choloepus didactylus TaxID=27675 RepID=UPI00189D0EFE|nr:leucine-rich repeat extensin-like protein 5 [Choloepus didactylus]
MAGSPLPPWLLLLTLLLRPCDGSPSPSTVTSAGKTGSSRWVPVAQLLCQTTVSSQRPRLPVIGLLQKGRLSPRRFKRLPSPDLDPGCGRSDKGLELSRSHMGEEGPREGQGLGRATWDGPSAAIPTLRSPPSIFSFPDVTTLSSLWNTGSVETPLTNPLNALSPSSSTHIPSASSGESPTIHFSSPSSGEPPTTPLPSTSSEEPPTTPFPSTSSGEPPTILPSPSPTPPGITPTSPPPDTSTHPRSGSPSSELTPTAHSSPPSSTSSTVHLSPTSPSRRTEPSAVPPAATEKTPAASDPHPGSAVAPRSPRNPGVVVAVCLLLSVLVIGSVVMAVRCSQQEASKFQMLDNISMGTTSRRSSVAHCLPE